MLYKKHLDDMSCNSPGCDHKAHKDGLYLHGRRHPDSGTFIFYNDECAAISCTRCGLGVTSVAIGHVAGDTAKCCHPDHGRFEMRGWLYEFVESYYVERRLSMLARG
jgi:hypothetical protein